MRSRCQRACERHVSLPQRSGAAVFDDPRLGIVANDARLQRLPFAVAAGRSSGVSHHVQPFTQDAETRSLSESFE